MNLREIKAEAEGIFKFALDNSAFRYIISEKHTRSYGYETCGHRRKRTLRN